MKRLIFLLLFLFFFCSPCSASLLDINGAWYFNGSYVTQEDAKYRYFSGAFHGTVFFDVRTDPYNAGEYTIDNATVRVSYYIGNQTVSFTQTTRGPFVVNGRLVQFIADGHGYNITFDTPSSRSGFLNVAGNFRDRERHPIHFTGAAAMRR